MRGWILICAMLVAGRVFAEDKTAAVLPIAVGVTYGDLSGSHPTLKAKLANQGHASITVEQAALPWGNRYSITLLAVGENTRYEQPLQLVFPIDDPMPGDVEIKPGEALQGTIRLDYVFKDILPMLKKGPLLVLWSYRLKSVDGRRSEQLTGYVRLPPVSSSVTTSHRDRR